MFMMDCLMAGKQLMGSLWAPPSGSSMMSSITPKLTSSRAVMRRASVACRRRLPKGLHVWVYEQSTGHTTLECFTHVICPRPHEERGESTTRLQSLLPACCSSWGSLAQKREKTDS